MFDKIRDSFEQMQPGDKMVMHLHKAQQNRPEYQMPGQGGAADSGGGASMGGGAGAGAVGAPAAPYQPTGSSLPGATSATGGRFAGSPYPAGTIPYLPGGASMETPLPIPGSASASPDPVAQRDQLIETLAARYPRV